MRQGELTFAVEGIFLIDESQEDMGEIIIPLHWLAWPMDILKARVPDCFVPGSRSGRGTWR